MEPSQVAPFRVNNGLVGAGRFERPTPLRPRDSSLFQGLHRFSLNPNNYNNLGNVLLKRQPR
jgi:hypothetical protein